MIKLIVAVDERFGIGYKGGILFRIKEERERFKQLTEGHFVIMSKKNYESLPGVLPNRTNVVIAPSKKYNPKDSSILVENDVERILAHYLTTGAQEKDLWVMGGTELYKKFLPYADEIHLTMVHMRAKYVDTYFPIEKTKELEMTLASVETFYSEENGCDVSFLVYKKKH